MEENVPKGGRDIETLLERCIEEFKDESKYKNDERYLNVWLKYVSNDKFSFTSETYTHYMYQMLPRVCIEYVTDVKTCIIHQK